MVFSSDEQEEDDDTDDAVAQDEAVIGFPSALAWLLGMTAVIAILSEYVVATIEVHFDPMSILRTSKVTYSRIKVIMSCLISSGCLGFLGDLCEFHQHYLAPNSWQRSGACRCHHLCLQEQAGKCNSTSTYLRTLPPMEIMCITLKCCRISLLVFHLDQQPRSPCLW